MAWPKPLWAGEVGEHVPYLSFPALLRPLRCAPPRANMVTTRCPPTAVVSPRLLTRSCLATSTGCWPTRVNTPRARKSRCRQRTYGGSTVTPFWDENIRHWPTPFLRGVGGHLGYHVVPTHRRRGHATAMLSAAVPVAAAFQVRLRCFIGSHASAQGPHPEAGHKGPIRRQATSNSMRLTGR